MVISSSSLENTWIYPVPLTSVIDIGRTVLTSLSSSPASSYEIYAHAIRPNFTGTQCTFRTLYSSQTDKLRVVGY